MNPKVETQSLEDKDFVFIGGLHRSGKSTLFRCLAQHSKVSGLYDADVRGAPLQDEGQHLQSVYPPGPESDGPVGFDASAHLDETSALATRDHARRLLADWRDYWDLDKPVLLENSPPNLVRTRYLQSLFPNSAFIIVLRHPIPVSYETMRWNADRVDKLIEHWICCHERFADDFDRIERAMIVKYEDLVSDTEASIRKVFDFLGLEDEPAGIDLREAENRTHFRRWRDTPLNRHNKFPIPRLFRLSCYVRFERRVRRFGYSLMHPAKSYPVEL